jgi:hypothetical protein
MERVWSPVTYPAAVTLPQFYLSNIVLKMAHLMVIKEADTANNICYITDEETAREKINNPVFDYSMVDKGDAMNILTEYSAFVEYGAKDTPSYVFTKANGEDWFIAQVEIKGKKTG